MFACNERAELTFSPSPAPSTAKPSTLGGRLLLAGLTLAAALAGCGPAEEEFTDSTAVTENSRKSAPMIRRPGCGTITSSCLCTGTA